MTERTPAVQLYSIRDALDIDAVGAFRRLRDIGVAEVELFGFVEREVLYRSALDETGLRAPWGHANLIPADGGVDGGVDAVFDAAQALGVTTVVEPAVRSGWDTVGGIDETAAALNALVDRAEGRGLTLGYHNHAWELDEVEGTIALVRLANALDPRIVLEVDVFWVAFAGLEPAEFVRRLGPRVRLLHLKDARPPGGVDDQVPIGLGEVDVAGALAAAPAAARIVEFDRYASDVFSAIEQSVRAVAEWGELE